MDRNFRKPCATKPTRRRPANLGCLPRPCSASPYPILPVQAEARAKREQLEWLASFSTEHEAQLRRLQSEEAEARHQGELLQWLERLDRAWSASCAACRPEKPKLSTCASELGAVLRRLFRQPRRMGRSRRSRTPKGTPDGGQ